MGALGNGERDGVQAAAEALGKVRIREGKVGESGAQPLGYSGSDGSSLGNTNGKKKMRERK